MLYSIDLLFWLNQTTPEYARGIFRGSHVLHISSLTWYFSHNERVFGSTSILSSIENPPMANTYPFQYTEQCPYLGLIILDICSIFSGFVILNVYQDWVALFVSILHPPASMKSSVSPILHTEGYLRFPLNQLFLSLYIYTYM